MKATLKSVGSLVLTMLLLTAAQLHANDCTPGNTVGGRTPLKPPANLTIIKKCCIAGTYEGIHLQIASATGKKVPTSFTMVIQQVTCGSSFTGTITDADGVVMSMQGTVSGSGNCCMIKGEARKISSLKLFSGARGKKTNSERIQFQGTLCQSSGQWLCSDGMSLNLESGSKGTFTLNQL